MIFGEKGDQPQCFHIIPLSQNTLMITNGIIFYNQNEMILEITVVYLDYIYNIILTSARSTIAKLLFQAKLLLF